MRLIDYALYQHKEHVDIDSNMEAGSENSEDADEGVSSEYSEDEDEGT